MADAAGLNFNVYEPGAGRRDFAFNEFKGATRCSDLQKSRADTCKFRKSPVCGDSVNK